MSYEQDSIGLFIMGIAVLIVQVAMWPLIAPSVVLIAFGLILIVLSQVEEKK